MADNSKIEWCDSSWSPIRARQREPIVINGKFPLAKWGYHCERISPGCVNCYASTMNGRMLPAWGTGLDYTVPNREKVEIFLDKEELLKPLKWKKPRRIFVESMSDWCATFVTDEMRDRILAVAALCPQHTFLHLTKRAKECAEYFSNTLNQASSWMAEDAIFQSVAGVATHGTPWPLPNVHLGFSAENQEYFDERWSHMRRLAAAGWKVWVSAEPLLGPIDASKALSVDCSDCEGWAEKRTGHDCIRCGSTGEINGLCQVVVGGESGHGARPMDIAWVRSIVRQCRDAGVACFVKQLGAFPVSVDIKVPNLERWRIVLKDRKGGDMDEWPEDLRVRQFPEAPNAPR